MKLADIRLPDMLAAPLRDDDTARAIAKVVNPYLQKLAEDALRVLLLPNVGQLPEQVLDALSGELRMPWYDYGVELAVKRDLVADSDLVHMRMGTPYAIEWVASAYFGDSTVEEWWAYGAQPYHFRVRTPNIDAVTRQKKVFEDVIAYTKNLRSVYDGVQVDQDIPTAQAYVGFVAQAAMTLTIPGGGP